MPSRLDPLGQNLARRLCAEIDHLLPPTTPPWVPPAPESKRWRAGIDASAPVGVLFVTLLGLSLLTGTTSPPDSAHQTRDSFNNSINSSSTQPLVSNPSPQASQSPSAPPQASHNISSIRSTTLTTVGAVAPTGQSAKEASAGKDVSPGKSRTAGTAYASHAASIHANTLQRPTTRVPPGKK
jgi:hypothetical protein